MAESETPKVGDGECIFPLKYALNEGAPQPEIVGMPILFGKMSFFVYFDHMGLLVGMQFNFC